ncbi:hypothetical protein P280DRAFT_130312 [Massarina eburnea CBS 473.64]|uniref:Uncharacterized protein n=1 Tax=Massarina eburnea CBS 473.64 TaxID=1395130 RepID=A0A6A6SDI2_9PLEO|nr:hypothetical protein P280DRAFT_130312 [Massarina eburnea CBS 473.64]
MAALKTPNLRDQKPDDAHDARAASPLAQMMREFEQLVRRYETGLLRSLEDAPPTVPKPDAPDAPDARPGRREDVRHKACRLAIAELSNAYTRKQIRRSLNAAESQGRREEEQLHEEDAAAAADDDDGDLRSIHNGYFRLYSTELFDLLGQPTDLRFGTLRFHQHDACVPEQAGVSVELALGSAFFVADSLETLPYHAFKMPNAPSLQNRGILSRKPEDNGAFPDYDSWLLFTFLGNGCLKLEVPIEMCADVYGGPLRGRENEEVHFWGMFVEDDAL